MKRALYLIALASLLSGCDVSPSRPEKASKPKKLRPIPEMALPTEDETREYHARQDRLPVLAFTEDLRVEVREVNDDVFEFLVEPLDREHYRPPNKTKHRILGKGACSLEFDASLETFTIRKRGGKIWEAQMKSLDRFGRARVPGLEISWRAKPGEAVYGLGERYDSLNLAGRRVDMWIKDAPGQSDDSSTYFVTPVVYSSQGFSFFSSTNPEGEFDLNSGGDGLHRYGRAGPRMKFYVAVGDDLKDLVRKRSIVQGPLQTIPDWAWGPWISRNSFENQAQAEEVLRGMFERELPVAVMVQEAWKGVSEKGAFNEFSRDRWPDLEGFMALCREHDVKNIVWQVPIIHPSSPHYRVGRTKGYFVKKPNGQISHRENWLPGFANIDFTNPEAVRFWKDLLRPLFKQGVWGFKVDDGEDIKPDDVFFDGRRGWEVHNEYSYLHEKALTELMNEEGVDGILWCRAGSLGIESTPALWAGDQYATWEQMASLIPAGLSCSLSGMPFWGHDIGGYIGQPTPELYIRWLQFGTLSPLMQYHGIARREPWEFGDTALEAYRFLSSLRMNLKPYLIKAGQAAVRYGTPIMRPMILEFPDDDRFRAEDSQYMLGPDMLVAPVIQAGVAGRKVLFPEGSWVHAIHPIAFDGPGEFEVPIGLVDAPLFIREGTTQDFSLDENARLGKWSPGATERSMAFTRERALIRNLTSPLVRSSLERRTLIRFERGETLKGNISCVWRFEDAAGTERQGPVTTNGNRITVSVTPSSKSPLAGRTQVYTIRSVDDTGTTNEIFSGRTHWRSPIQITIEPEGSMVVDQGMRNIITRIRNVTDRPVDVQIRAKVSQGGRMLVSQQNAMVPPDDQAELHWGVEFLPMDTVGDTRVTFATLAGNVPLERKEIAFPRMPRWVVVGPFPAQKELAFSTPFAPEWCVAPGVAFETEKGLVQWEPVASRHFLTHGCIDFNNLFGPTEHAAAYAMTRLWSEMDREVELRFGSDDTLSAWLNGERIHENETYRAAEPDQEIVPVRLKAGVNTLLAKVGQNTAGWQLYFRATGKDGRAIRGLRDGFSDFSQFRPSSRPAKVISGHLPVFDWKLLGPVMQMPSADSKWKLPYDEMAHASEWPPKVGGENWRDVPKSSAPDNAVDLNRELGGASHAVAYAAASISVSHETKVRLESRSDDGIVIWLNGNRLIAAHSPREFSAAPNVVEATLHPGENRLLCRISQDSGEWKFQISLFDLSINPPKPIPAR
ncbi:MAG: hypothetical protein KJ626_05665 [Verrucomicrobia bacterium]|nr:hypothetical protein [Verrucomicrobiota bacterium]